MFQWTCAATFFAACDVFAPPYSRPVWTDRHIFDDNLSLCLSVCTCAYCCAVSCEFYSLVFFSSLAGGEAMTSFGAPV